MKVSYLALALPLFFLGSCALSSEKAQEEEGSGSAIPPPTTAHLSDGAASNQESLPPISENSEQAEASDSAADLSTLGEFVVRDPTKDLPTSRELSTPPSPVILDPREQEGEDDSSEVENETKPLVANP